MSSSGKEWSDALLLSRVSPNDPSTTDCRYLRCIGSGAVRSGGRSSFCHHWLRSAPKQAAIPPVQSSFPNQDCNCPFISWTVFLRVFRYFRYSFPSSDEWCERAIFCPELGRLCQDMAALHERSCLVCPRDCCSQAALLCFAAVRPADRPGQVACYELVEDVCRQQVRDTASLTEASS